MANKDRDAVSSGLNDLLGNVIRTDRERAGRGKGEAPPEAQTEVADAPAAPQTSLAAPSEPANTNTLRHYDTMTEGAEKTAPSVPARLVAPAKRKAKTNVVRRSADASGRVEEAQEMAESSTMTVTLRIPQDFNEWLDEYVHRSWPQKVRKQELVTEALKLLYARRGRAGEDILSTPLLGEEGE